MGVLKITVLGFFAVLTATVAANDCTAFAPDHESIECRIVTAEDDCYRYEENGELVNQCDYSAPCRVWTGMQLRISCGEEYGDVSPDTLSLFRDNSTLGGHEMSWSFATTELEGLYECRLSDNGNLVANRSIIVDEGVYVIPSNARSYIQQCRRDIVPDSIPNYNCSVAQGVHRFTAGLGGKHTVWFNVVGVRPIDVMVEVIWVNHYPVDLHLSWNSEASNSTSSHKVELDSSDLVFVGDIDTVGAYAVITANNTFQSSTMCVNLRFHGGSTLFPNEGIAKQITAREGQSAEFDCSVRIDDGRINDGATATVAFLVQSSESRDPVQCLNCTFSSRELSLCLEGNCSGLQFFSSSTGDPNMLTHNLTAQWNRVDVNQSGHEVVCAVAVDGVTQWVHSATLTVLPATAIHTTPHVTATHTSSPTDINLKPAAVTSTTPHVTSTTSNPPQTNSNKSTRSLTTGGVVGVAVSAVVGVAILVSVFALGAIVLYRQRQRKHSRL